MVQAANIGQPFVLNARRFSKSAKAIQTIATEIEEFAPKSSAASTSAPAEPAKQQSRREHAEPVATEFEDVEPLESALLDEEWE